MLFTDIVGSTAVAASRGDAAADEILDVHAQVVREQAAEDHFAVATDQAFRLPHRIECAETLRLHARMLLRRGGLKDVGRAARMLEEAVTAYYALGMPRHAGMAREMSLAPA